MVLLKAPGVCLWSMSWTEWVSDSAVRVLRDTELRLQLSDLQLRDFLLARDLRVREGSASPQPCASYCSREIAEEKHTNMINVLCD